MAPIIRMPDDNVVKKVLQFNVTRIRMRGRPRLLWTGSVESDFGIINEKTWRTKGVLVTAHQNVWFKHDGTPVQLIVGCKHLHVTYPGRWLGRGGSVAWPPPSLNPNHFDFFFWDNLKTLVYETPVATTWDFALVSE
ncbi:uncharacterized protein TNCV_2023231 [Trichonephila clavipes]|nr:uncharacterized protein TNCV_2023231 [Trichonephila clavipes]